MNKQLTLLLALLLSFTINAQKETKEIEQFVKEIDKKIPQLLHDFLVPGAAIAIIENGEIVLQKGYGFSDLENEVKVTTKTGFNIGSISKTIAAWGVMKLVQEGKIDLDAPAENYLTRWHFPESEFNSNEVTIRRLLSHTAGLSLHSVSAGPPYDKLPTLEEWLIGQNNGLGRVEIILEPGSRYKYSGGGYGVLQLIIEEVTGQTFEDYIQAEVLDPLGMKNSSYKIDEKIIAASATPYDRYGETIDLGLFTVQAGAGLHVTIEDFTRFAIANLYRHEDFEKHNSVLSGSIIQQMMKAVPQNQGRYGYGLGYFVESIPDTSVILNGHRGSNDGWEAIFNVNSETHDGFIMITNGSSGSHVYNSIFYDWVLWNLGVTLEDWHKAKPSIEYKMKTIVDSIGTDDIAAIYTKLKENQPENYDYSDGNLNNLGYHYKGQGKLKKALAIFKLNTEAFPYAYNTYDSYGETLLLLGAREEAIENYRYSIFLNPENENGKSVLKELEVSTNDIALEIPIEHLRLLEGEYTMTSDVNTTISYAIENGELVGKFKDKERSIKLVPIGMNEFVYPSAGIRIVFDTKDSNAITLTYNDKSEYKKVK